MKPAALFLVVTGLAFGAAAGVCGWLMARYAPGYAVGSMFMDADIIAKLVMMLIVLLIVAAVLAGVIGLAVGGRASALRVLLILLAAACAGLGLLAFLYDWMNIQSAIRAVGPVRFAVTAPSYAEALMVLSLGLFGALVALGFHLPLSRRKPA